MARTFMDASLITFGADAPNAALTLNRVALGTFFAISGDQKLCAFGLDARKRVATWNPISRADWLGDLLYLPETLFCIGLAVVMLAGPGS